MGCANWNDDWIAELYGELDPAERDRLQRHLAGCEPCRRTLADLSSARAALRSHAPAVPPAPRFVGLPRPASRYRSLATFAGGVAAALALFAVGVLAAPGLRTTPAAAATGVTPEHVQAAIAEALADQRRAFEAELATLRAGVDQARVDDRAVDVATRSDTISSREFEGALAALERRITVSRASDVEFLLGELQATEARAAEWFDDNREALMLVAMRNDPRFSER